MSITENLLDFAFGEVSTMLKDKKRETKILRELKGNFQKS